MAQIDLTLSQEARKAETSALVRKDAPNELLIGTDVQPRLGFSLVVKGVDGQSTDLFSDEGTTSTTTPVTASGTLPPPSPVADDNPLPSVTEDQATTDS